MIKDSVTRRESFRVSMNGMGFIVHVPAGMQFVIN